MNRCAAIVLAGLTIAGCARGKPVPTRPREGVWQGRTKAAVFGQVLQATRLRGFTARVVEPVSGLIVTEFRGITYGALYLDEWGVRLDIQLVDRPDGVAISCRPIIGHTKRGPFDELGPKERASDKMQKLADDEVTALFREADRLVLASPQGG